MRSISLVVLVMVGMAAAEDTRVRVQVNTAGEMRSLMQKGDLSAAMDLRKLAKTKHLYALGPVEGLKGEVTVWDGKASIARVVAGKIATSDSFEVKACFLVYAEVPSWQETAIPGDVRDIEQLEAFVAKAAAKAKLDVSRPFPFAVRGTFGKLAFHVVNKTDDSPHSREKHDRVKVHFTAEKAAARLIGFYSDHHHGVFTHHGSNVHIHVITDDNQQSGHVESIRLGADSVLLLPKP